MEYEIKIITYGENKNYDQEMKDWNQRREDRRYNNPYPETSDPRPEKMIEVKCLETRVDQEQFEVIRKAVLEVL